MTPLLRISEILRPWSSFGPPARTALAAALLLFLALPGAGALQAQDAAPPASPTVEGQAPDPEQRLELDPRVRAGTLDNGLAWFVRQNARPEGRVELRLAVNAGSLLEEEHELGLAHFLEHMAFRGTTNFERQALVGYLESIGMRFGPDLNAYTSFDETVYLLTVPTDDPEIVETAFRILRDWASEVTIHPDDVDRERGVVIEEWRGRRGAQARVIDQHLPVMLQGARHAERLPIGTLEVLESATAEDLRGFYERWYRPDLMAVVAVGDLDPETMEGLIRTLFGDLEAPSGSPERPVFPVPAHAETLFSVVTDPEISLTQVELLHKDAEDAAESSGPARGTVGEYRERLAARLYTAMLNARLQEITRETEAPFLNAAVNRGELVRGARQFSLSAVVEDGGTESGLLALLAEAERVNRHGFTSTELDRARTNLLRGLERAYDERERTNSGVFASDLVSHFLAGSPMPGIEAELELARALLPELALEEINALARGWMSEESRVVLVTAPSRDDAPAGAEVAARVPTPETLTGVLAAVEGLEIEPYVDEVTEAPLVAELPPLAEITERRYHEEVELHEWVLENGVRVLLRPTDFRDDEILLRGWAPGGSSLVPEEDHPSASFATDVVGVSGLGAFNVTALQRALAGKAASVSVGLTEREQRIQGGASPRDLETLFQLAWLHFTEPRFDEGPVQAILGQIRAILANRGADPGAHFADTLQVTLSQGHPRARPISVELMEEIDPERAYAIYRERFGHADGFTFLLVGNLELEQVEPLVRRYLGNLPVQGRVDEPADPGIRPPEGVVERTVARGIEPRSQTQIIFHGPWTWEPDRNFALASLVEVLRLRLREVLREDLGGTYGVQVLQTTRRVPDERFTLQVAFGTDPERLEELVDAVFAELASLRDEGPTADEMSRVREIQRRERETALRQNGFWASSMEGLIKEDRPLSAIFALEDRIGAVTPEVIQAIAAEAFTEDRYVRVSLVPEG
jgi:zinc protease